MQRVIKLCVISLMIFFCNALHPQVCALQNGMYPNAVMNKSGEIICSAIHWNVPFLPVAQKIGCDGKRMWTDDPSGIFLAPSHGVNPYGLHEYRPPKILPAEDGGAYFVFDYNWLLDIIGGIEYFKEKTYIQRVSPEGNLMWGNIGKQIVNEEITNGIGSFTHFVEYASDGNILVYYRWYHHSNESELGESEIYIQKINKDTGDRMWGDHGNFVNPKMTNIILGSTEQTYLLYNDYVLCLNKNGEELWYKKILEGFDLNLYQRYATNDYGDVIILYRENEQIRGMMFNNNGEFLWKNKVIVENGYKIFHNSEIKNWNNKGWLFATSDVGINFVDIAGENINIKQLLLPESNDRHQKMNIFDNNTFYTMVTLGPFEPDGVNELKIYRVNQYGELLWEPVSRFIARGVDSQNSFLLGYDNNAYAVYEATGLFDPLWRPRGTFVQKVDIDGQTGYTTSIKSNTHVKNQQIYTFNTPNPFTQNTIFHINGMNPAKPHFLRLKIYNILGEEVKNYKVNTSSQHNISVQWNGTDNMGRSVCPGIYLYQIIMEGKIAAKGKLLKGK
ncbi:T9SS type A sorting domain-containing protein [candidate division KSB1 bacterium]|nr:T9SS type A sorting domain-containing protein [candidate division KSB1 bacterium]